MATKKFDIDTPYMLKVGNKFIGIDDNSGGHPYVTRFNDANRWAKVEDAFDYGFSGTGIARYVGNCVPEIIKIVAVEYETVNYKKIIDQNYEKELEELNKKYNK